MDRVTTGLIVTSRAHASIRSSPAPGLIASTRRFAAGLLLFSTRRFAAGLLLVSTRRFAAGLVMMSTRRFAAGLGRLLVVAATLAAASCGPDELPAFANPPPEDAGPDADQDDGGSTR
jgi:hypothetical protein